MKFVLMFCSDGQDTERFRRMAPADLAEQAARVADWFDRNKARITGGNQLGWPADATTVRWDAEGRPLVGDGPFLGGNEVIGGYAEIEVDDLDEALEMARTWPPRGAVEIRPIREQP